MATVSPEQRIVTLDIVRGVAVMGILAMNILGFAMPLQAYMNPAAYGTESAADYVAWAFNFVFFDGKMRGLFSFLFGASMLLVIERAAASGRSPGSVHFSRMLWLLVFGLVHFYFIWFGDILAEYAIAGMIAFLFHRLSPKALVGWGLGLLAFQTMMLASIALSLFFLQASAADPDAPAQVVQAWRQMLQDFGVPGEQALGAKMNLFLGGYGPILEHRLVDRSFDPFSRLLMFGWETLAYFLFGMALLKTGFFRGEWAPSRYRRVMLIGFAVGIPVYAGLAFLLYRDGFSVPMVFACALAATVPVRPPMVIATAALIILATRSGGTGVGRIAAAGRMAFTNYIFTSVAMTTLFYGYGFGLYGSLSRAELWIVVVAMWVLMLLWSKPWLDRFAYGPLEWLWRSLARGRVQPIRRGAPAA